MHAEIMKLANADIVRESLACYCPSKGNSRVVPWLMRRKWVGLLMQVCKYKARKRYGKRGIVR